MNNFHANANRNANLLSGLQQLDDCEMAGLQNDEEQTNASLIGKSSVNLA